MTPLHPYQIAVACRNNIYILDENYCGIRVLQDHARVLSIMQLRNGLLVSTSNDQTVQTWDYVSGLRLLSWVIPTSLNPFKLYMVGEAYGDGDCIFVKHGDMRFCYLLNLTMKTCNYYHMLGVHIVPSPGTKLIPNVSLDLNELKARYGNDFKFTLLVTDHDTAKFYKNIHDILIEYLPRDLHRVVADYVIVYK